MGEILSGTAINFCNAHQTVWVETPRGNISCLAQTEINAAQVMVIVDDAGRAYAFCGASPVITLSQVTRRLRSQPPVVAELPERFDGLFGIDLEAISNYQEYPGALILYNAKKPFIKLPLTLEAASSLTGSSCIWLNSKNQLFGLAFPFRAANGFVYYFSKTPKTWKRKNLGFPVEFDDFAAHESNSIYIQMVGYQGIDSYCWIADIERDLFEPIPISGSQTAQSFSLNFDFPVMPGGIKYPFSLSGSLSSDETSLNSQSSGSYAYPYLIDPDSGQHVLFSFSGSASNEVISVFTDEGYSHNRYTRTCTDTGGAEMVFADGSRRNIVGRSQYMIFIDSRSFPDDGSDLVVGQVLSGSFSTNWGLHTTPPYPIPAQLIGMPAKEMRFRWNIVSQEGELRTELTSQSAMSGCLEELASLSAEGQPVFGHISYNEGVGKTTIFKGVIRSFSYSSASSGQGITTYFFGVGPGQYFVNVLSFSIEVTEIVAVIPSDSFNVKFNEQFYPGGYLIHNPATKIVGKFFLDGSLLNIMSSCYTYGGEGIAINASDGIAGHVFSSDAWRFRVGNRYIWRDPFVWRVTRDYLYNADAGESNLSRDAYFFRWRINYEADPIRFEFDGVERFALNTPEDVEPSLSFTQSLCFLPNPPET